MTAFDLRLNLFDSDATSLFDQVVSLMDRMHAQSGLPPSLYNGYLIVILNAVNEHLFEEMHNLFIESIEEEFGKATSPNIKMGDLGEVLLDGGKGIVKNNHQGGFEGFKNMAKKIHGGRYVFPDKDHFVKGMVLLVEGLPKKVPKSNPLPPGVDPFEYRGLNYLRNLIAHNGNIVDFSVLNTHFSSIKTVRYRAGMSDLDMLKKIIDDLKNGFLSLSKDYFAQCNTNYHV